MKPTIKYAFALICGSRSKPNGRAGTYKTREAADTARSLERQSTFIRRVAVSPERWAMLKG